MDLTGTAKWKQWLGTATTSSPKATKMDDPRMKRKTMYMSKGIKSSQTSRAHLRKEELDNRRKSSRQEELAIHRRVDPGKASKDDPAPVTASLVARQKRLTEWKKTRATADSKSRPKPFVVGKADFVPPKFDFAAHKKRVGEMFVFGADRRSALVQGKSQGSQVSQRPNVKTAGGVGLPAQISTLPDNKSRPVKRGGQHQQQPKPVIPTKPVTAIRKPLDIKPKNRSQQPKTGDSSKPATSNFGHVKESSEVATKKQTQAPEKPSIVVQRKSRPSNLVTSWKDTKKTNMAPPKVTEPVFLASSEDNEALGTEKTYDENSEKDVDSTEQNQHAIGWGKTWKKKSPEESCVEGGQTPRVIGWGKTPESSPTRTEKNGQEELSPYCSPIIDSLSKSLTESEQKLTMMSDTCAELGDSLKDAKRLGWGKTPEKSPVNQLDLTCQSSSPQTPKQTIAYDESDGGSGMLLTRVQKATQEKMSPTSSPREKFWQTLATTTVEKMMDPPTPKTTPVFGRFQLAKVSQQRTPVCEPARPSLPQDSGESAVPLIRVSSYEEECRNTGGITQSNIENGLKCLKPLPGNCKRRESLLVRGTPSADMSNNSSAYFTPSSNTIRSQLTTLADDFSEEHKDTSKMDDGPTATAVTKTVVKKTLKSLKPLPEGCKKRGSLAIRRKLSGDSSEEEEYHSAGEEEDHDDEAKDGVHELADTLTAINIVAVTATSPSKLKTKRGKQVNLLASSAAQSSPASPRRSTRLSGVSRKYKE